MRFPLTLRASFGFDDFIDIAVILFGQVKELKPVLSWYQMEVMLRNVAHEQKLACEELAVHLIGLNGKESAEAPNSLSVQPFSLV